MDQGVVIWASFAFALLTSYGLAGIVIRAADRLNIGTDELTGVQKFHTHRVSRLGGIPVYVALISSLLLLAWALPIYKIASAFLIVCLLPVFGIGLLEDVTRKVGASTRLLVAMIAALLGWWLFNGVGLHRIGLDPVDAFLAEHAWAALAMTVMAVSGAAHGLNIIDGCNGLSGFFIMVALGAIAVVALNVGDLFVLHTSLLALGATLGFFLWNFPRGRIFLGDSGAYMMGVLIAELSLILLRHREVSPWCPMLIMAYPAWETLFSMYRRGHHGLRQMGRPDARHLHQLIYRRIMKWAPEAAGYKVRHFRSAFTAVMIWPLILLCMAPAALFWNRTQALFWLTLLFAVTYMAFYLSIVRFRVPRLITRMVAFRKKISEPVPKPG